MWYTNGYSGKHHHVIFANVRAQDLLHHLSLVLCCNTESFKSTVVFQRHRNNLMTHIPPVSSCFNWFCMYSICSIYVQYRLLIHYMYLYLYVSIMYLFVLCMECDFRRLILFRSDKIVWHTDPRNRWSRPNEWRPSTKALWEKRPQ